MPWWLGAILGLVCVGIGVALIGKPFDSLSVLVLLVGAAFILTGLSELASARTSGSPRLTSITGFAWVVVGLTLLVWPGLTLKALALVAGISMLVDGSIKVAAAVRGTADDRLISAFSGFAGVVFGVLALLWPDVTVLVIALLVGPRIVLLGLSQIASALSRRTDKGDIVDLGQGSRWPRWLRIAGASTALVVALGLAGVSAWLHGSSPAVDAFYSTPEEVPGSPGQLLRSEPFERDVPDGAKGWRILYSTTRDDGTPGVASAIVVAPDQASSGPRPNILWTHGTTGVERQCAPSIARRPFESGALFVADAILDRGWVLIAPDYIGLGTEGPHPYLIGRGEALPALDAVRAARQLPALDLSDETVVWGHSQGGHAALWTGVLAPAYRPDVHIAGVAALAPASDLLGLLEGLDEGPIATTMFSYVIHAYSRVYPDISLNDQIRAVARVFVRRTAGRCLTEPAALVSVLVALPFEGSIFSMDPSQGAMGERLRQNVPQQPIEAPLLIAQGLSDSLVLPAVQHVFVNARCEAGQHLEYRTYEGRDHISLVEGESPLIEDLFAWTEGVLAGTVVQDGCVTVAR